MQKTSTSGALGGGAEGPGALTINAKNIYGRPLGSTLEVWENPPTMQKTSTVGPWEAVTEV
jgi:hypothetical protein